MEKCRTNRSEVTTVYTYTPAVAYNKVDSLHRFGQLKIEATSFTISEPTEYCTIAPMLYDYADSPTRMILEKQFDLAPFKIRIISLDRMFVDKLFAAEAYSRDSDIQQHAFETAKHIYDLTVMSHLDRINNLMENTDRLKYLLDIRIEEETSRLDGIPYVIPKEFTLFDSIITDSSISAAYEIMQN